ncbi:MAG: diguanylate cyclase [Burkholderiales bacterium]
MISTPPLQTAAQRARRQRRALDLCRGLLLVACVLLGVGAARASDPPRWDPLVDTVFWHIEQPDSSGPIAFAEDRTGFLWVGTQNGLARWDGYRFRKYRPNPQELGALPDGFIHALHRDARGRLWVATNAGGLLWYDGETDRFVATAAGPEGSVRAPIAGIADDDRGGLWLATDAGLYRLSPDGSTASRVPIDGAPHDDSSPAPPAPQAVLALLRDHSGALWLATRNQLLRGDGNVPVFAEVPVPDIERGAITITCLLEDSAHRIWVGTAAHGAFVIEEGGRARPVQENPTETGQARGPATSKLQTDEVMAMVEARDGEVWVGTNGRGILAVDTTTWQTRRLRHDPMRPTSLADDDITDMYRDRAGLVWVGTTLRVSTHDPRTSAVSTVFGATARSNGISRADVPAVLVAPDGRVWLSVGDEGVDIIDPLQGRVAQLRADPTQPDRALPGGRVLAMAGAPGGDTYLGTKGGLYRVDATGRRVARVHLAKRASNAAVWALFADGDTLWIGGLDGLWTLDLRSGDSRPGSRHPATDRLSDARIVVITRAPGGVLWIGTRNGLNRLDLGSGAVDQFMPKRGDPKTLPAGYVTAIAPDGAGRLWVGTVGGGIGVMTAATADLPAQFHRIDVGTGLPNNSVSKLLFDASGRVWASTDDGLAVIDPVSFATRALRQADGVAIPTYWSNSGAKTAQGELLFGGLGGLTVLRPERLTNSAYHPPIAVTDLSVDGHAVSPERFHTPGAVAPLAIPPGARGLAVEFAALDYSAPGSNQYAYRLDGYDTAWITTDASRRLAAYTNLPPGEYVLQLRGSNRHGIWTEHPLALPLRVLPAWYQTLWFRLAAGLCALALVAALVQGRTALLRQRQRQLEDQVSERTAELQASQRQLENMAYRDVLTDLPNRRMFVDEFRQRLAQARRQGQTVALLLIDLDHFKQVNDTLGHDAGDALLVGAAKRLREAVRESDTVARLGGDEFAILASDLQTKLGIEVVCQRIIDSFATPVPFKGATLATSPSIGVAIFHDHGDSQDALYKAADLALYEAKRAGRNTWRWYSPEMGR